MSSNGYILLATVFYLRQEDGSRKRFRTGDVVTGLNAEQVERLLRAKAIGKAADLPTGPGADEATVDQTDTTKPGEGANKPVLVDWIFNNVAKPDGADYTKSELNKLKVDDLRAIIDSVED